MKLTILFYYINLKLILEENVLLDVKKQRKEFSTGQFINQITVIANNN